MVAPLVQATNGRIPLLHPTIEDTHQSVGADYEPDLYPGNLTLFRCSSKAVLDGPDDLLGWDGLAAGGIEFHRIPSAHETILKDPGLSVLSHKIRECLDRDSSPLTARSRLEPVEDSGSQGPERPSRL
jgi:hypothetical protein